MVGEEYVRRVDRRRGDETLKGAEMNLSLLLSRSLNVNIAQDKTQLNLNINLNKYYFNKYLNKFIVLSNFVKYKIHFSLSFFIENIYLESNKNYSNVDIRESRYN